MIGQTIAQYRIQTKIGEGGMGVVYRATDLRLGRDVAVKLLPEIFAHDAERMSRFAREATVLASLNHPNIAAIFGLEEATRTRLLVMELVEGCTVAERIRRGPMPLDDALPIAKQIADALEYAHEHGVIHRDLKPANVMITPDAHVKLLDFGLAKALLGESEEEQLDDSPTLTAAATRAGVLLGTAAYMAPEQARGKRVDRRADIWAFGAVLYEMLTAHRAFSGETTSDTVAAVIRAEPDWARLPPNTPTIVRQLLHRCLHKDSRRRLQAIGEARVMLEEALPGGAEIEVPAQRSSSKLRLYAVAITVVAIAALVLSLMRRSVPSPPAQPPVRFTLTLPSPDALELSFGSNVAISSDGSRIAYAAGHDGATRLYLRDLSQFEAKPLEGTDGAEHPFFSPDGRWLGFFAAAKLQKIPVAGGPAISLCNTPGGLGATWLRDNVIIFNADYRGGLRKIPASGGASEEVIQPDHHRGEQADYWPEALPDGENLLFSVRKGTSAEMSDISLLSLKSHQVRTLIPEGSNPHYLANGYILYVHSGILMAVPFDLEQLRTTGAPFPVLQGVTYDPEFGNAQAAVSANGTLVYVMGSFPTENLLVTVDRAGHERPLNTLARPYEDMYLSPHGDRMAVTIMGDLWNIWLYDFARQSLSRLTFDGDNRDPVWTGDGQHIAYSSFRNGRFGLYWKRADGNSAEEELFSSDDPSFSTSATSDGNILLLDETNGAEGNHSFFLLPLHGPRKPRLVLQTSTFAGVGSISPDGKWLAYSSFESGSEEVYVRSVALSGGKWQISASGGTRPIWAKDGRELFFRTTRDNGEVMYATIQTEPAFAASTPQVLFPYQYRSSGHDYDVSPDGTHFFFIKSSKAQLGPNRIYVTLAWASGLKR
jgi:eukaryotic-like serine/threonine-protein kinase